ncbi:hypothetical protein ACLMJK_002789 [Lecanora helva]
MTEGSSPQVSNKDPKSALQAAFSNSDRVTADVIAKKAARTNDADTLREALRLGANPQDYVIQALSTSSGWPDAYLCLLEAGLDVNYHFPGYMGNALIVACKYGQAEIVRVLLSRGADPNLEGVGYGGPEKLGALAGAAECFKKEAGVKAMRLLLDAGAEARGSGALQVAAKWGHLERVKILIEDAKVDVRDVNPRLGGTATSLAREHKRGEVLEYLEGLGGTD